MNHLIGEAHVTAGFPPVIRTGGRRELKVQIKHTHCQYTKESRFSFMIEATRKLCQAQRYV